MQPGNETETIMKKIRLRLFFIAAVISLVSVFLWQHRSKSVTMEAESRRTVSSLSSSNLLLTGYIDTTLRSTCALADLAGQMFAQLDSDKFVQLLDSIFRNNPSVAAIQIISLSGSGATTSDLFKSSKTDSPDVRPSINDKQRENLIKTGLTLVQDDKKNLNTNTKIDTSPIEIGIPTIALARQIQQTKTNRWIVIYFWSTDFLSVFKKTEKFSNFIVNKNGHHLLNQSLEHDPELKSGHAQKTIAEAIEAKNKTQTLRTNISESREIISNATLNEEFNIYVISQIITEHSILPNLQQSSAMLPAVALIVLLLILFCSINARIISREMQFISTALDAIKDGALGSFTKTESPILLGLLNKQIMELQRLYSDHKLGIKHSLSLNKEENSLPKEKIVPPAKSQIDSNGISTQSFFINGKSQSGDWWNRFSLSDGIELIVLSDSSCNITQANFISSLTHSFFKETERNLTNSSETEKLSLKALLRDLHLTLCSASGERFKLDLSLLLFDLPNDHVSIVTMGNHFIYSISQESSLSISSMSPPLGVQSDIEVKESTLKINNGDRFFLHTDGLFECKNENNEKLSESLIFEQFKLQSDSSFESFSKQTISTIENHFQNHPLKDDLSIVLIEVCNSASLEFTSSWDIEESKIVPISDLSGNHKP
ncbi:MAG: Phosphoserine phosphatase [Pseudomonadota bacterium]|jgi:hypothetical protein